MIRDILMAHRDTPGLAPDVPTLAEALRDQGYHAGLVGKWHLGAAEGTRPADRGFDESFGHLRAGAPSFLTGARGDGVGRSASPWSTCDDGEADARRLRAEVPGGVAGREPRAVLARLQRLRADPATERNGIDAPCP